VRYDELLNLLCKYADKYQRYSKDAYSRADEFNEPSTFNDAECYGANNAEGETFDYVSRELRQLISAFNK
jgi:hypothetical protein